jgi:hypothetical protein
MEVFDKIEIIDSKDVIIKVLDVMSNIKYFNKEDKEIIKKIIEKLDNVEYNELINILQECVDNKYYKANTRNKLKKISTELQVKYFEELMVDFMHNAKTKENNIKNEQPENLIIDNIKTDQPEDLIIDNIKTALDIGSIINEYQQNVAIKYIDYLIQHDKHIETMKDKDIIMKDKEIELKKMELQMLGFKN